MDKMDKKMQDLTEFGSTWWGKKWIESMLTFGKFMRMQRSISYTKENRVSDIIVNKGEIFAQCQGTAPTPYRIKIRFEPITTEKWNQIIQKLSENVLYESQLLYGEMPPNINDIFVKEGIPLFPPIKENLNADCTCPDKEVPCKHIAAVILSIAKIFDYDPFLLIKLRGMDKEELLLKIEEKRFPNLKIDSQKQKIEEEYESIKLSEENRDTFLFPKYENVEDLAFNINESNYTNSILERIKNPPDIEKEKDFMESIKKIYSTASKYASNLIQHEKEENDEKE
jgi:uncharacterized Zn finger protein